MCAWFLSCQNVPGCSLGCWGTHLIPKAVQGIGILLAMRPLEEGAAVRSPIPVSMLLALVVASTPAAGWSTLGLPAIAEQVG